MKQVTVNSEWTFEQAKAEQDKVIAANPERWSDPETPLFQWLALKQLDEYKESFLAGDRFLLMLAIRKCAQCGLPLPEWVSRAYIKAFDSVLNARVKSWDEAFSPPYKKGANLAALRKKRELEFGVWNEIRGIIDQEPETKVDTALFEKVGARFNIGKTLCSEYYYSVNKLSGNKTRL